MRGGDEAVAVRIGEHLEGLVTDGHRPNAILGQIRERLASNRGEIDAGRVIGFKYIDYGLCLPFTDARRELAR